MVPPTLHLLRLRWYGHTERLNNKRMPKQTANARMEGARKAQKRWTDEVEDNMKEMGREWVKWRSVLNKKKTDVT